MCNKIMDLVKKTRSSNFNRDNYCVSIELKRFVDSMLLHTWYDILDIKSTLKKNDVTNKSWLDRVTPPFQRANNKWTKKMKLKFIENLLSGANTELLFYRMGELEDSLIIDGLQRTTAIIDFFDGKIKPFGYSYQELKEYLGAFNTHLAIKIYTFDTIEEVVKFYIDMNENITHSRADIQKAKDWLMNEKGV